MIYENGIAKTLLVESGYFSLADGKYHYYLKDHLGNNRVVVDEDGKVEEQNDYYPFGGLMSSSTASVQPYKYNGKELDTKNGLDWYDYGARHYDAAIGRWHVVDPMAEKYNIASPYNYCNNNPIRYVDLNGESWEDAWPFLKNSISGSFSIGLRVEASAKIEQFGVKLGANMGSIEFGGDHGKKVSSGISATVGVLGIEMYDSAYELDSRKSVKEEGYTVGLFFWEEDHKTTTTYDSTGKYFEKIATNETVETTAKADLDISAHAIIGINLSIDLISIKDFIVNLFK